MIFYAYSMTLVTFIFASSKISHWMPKGSLWNVSSFDDCLLKSIMLNKFFDQFFINSSLYFAHELPLLSFSIITAPYPQKRQVSSFTGMNPFYLTSSMMMVLHCREWKSGLHQYAKDMSLKGFFQLFHKNLFLHLMYWSNQFDADFFVHFLKNRGWNRPEAILQNFSNIEILLLLVTWGFIPCRRASFCRQPSGAVR